MATGPGDDPDAALVARLQAGDDGAFAEIVRRHGARLKGLAHRICRNAAVADDVVQDAFLAAWRAGRGWQPGPVPFAAWLTRIAVNRAIDSERRGRIRRFFGLEAAEERAADVPSAEAAIDGRATLASVARDIRALPARQRAAILLAATGEHSNADIAATLGISEGATEQLLVRARRRLRDQLAAREERKDRA